MKKWMVGAGCLALAAMAGNAQAQLTCFRDARVTQVGVGDIRGLPGSGPDIATAIYFRTDKSTKVHSLNIGMNLNDPQGNAMHRTLLLSMLGGYGITAVDKNNVINCDDVDEIWIN
jgi:hypothetical protein